MTYSQEMLNKRKKYYTSTFIQFELLKAMKGREVIFMSKSNNSHCIRGMFITTIDMLNKFFDIFNFFEKDYNIYVSLAKYYNLPFFSTDLTIRSKETGEFFRNNVFYSVCDYDILIDLDLDLARNKIYDNLLLDARKVFQILHSNEINFNCFPSGSGIQMVIKGEQIENKKFFKEEEEKLLENTEKPFNRKTITFLEKFKERFNIKSLCLKGMGTIHKIRKCEYSLVDDRICFPVSSIGEIEELKKKDFDCNYILSVYTMKGRGLKIFTYDLNFNNTSEFCFEKFLEKYSMGII